MTSRTGLVALFGACLAGLLVADWANWGELADATFFLASTITAYYVRPGSLLPVVASPPLLFLVACVVASALTSSGPLASLEGTLVALAGSAWWMLAGMALTVAIALARGLSSEIRGALPLGSARTSSCGAPGGAGRPSSP